MTGRRISDGVEPHSRGRSTAPSFAVIIPVRNEVSLVPGAIAGVTALSRDAEIIVVDGGSEDGSAAAARAAGARVVLSPPGRGIQMNAGARQAKGQTLLFLHVDCRLPAGAFPAMEQVLAAGYGAGVFAIDYASPHPLLRLLSRLSRLRTPWTEFGEASLFVRRRVFEEIGGFPDWPLFEDQEILARLRRRTRIGRAHGCIQASPRRYVESGVWRQQALNVLLYSLFRLGVSPSTLARHYDARKERASLNPR